MPICLLYSSTEVPKHQILGTFTVIGSITVGVTAKINTNSLNESTTCTETLRHAICINKICITARVM